jgi:hypothetical protein
MERVIAEHRAAGEAGRDGARYRLGQDAAEPVAASTICRQSVHIVPTHPLFGPQSVARDGLAGRQLVICPARGDQHLKVAALGEELGLRVQITTAEEHDREMAYVQALTHLVGRTLGGMHDPGRDAEDAELSASARPVRAAEAGQLRAVHRDPDAESLRGTESRGSSSPALRRSAGARCTMETDSPIHPVIPAKAGIQQTICVKLTRG